MPSESPPSFADLGLAPPVLQAVVDAGYEIPSPIQCQGIPPLLAGHDLLGQAQTGTGKTAAFVLPALCRLDVKEARPQVLVLTPTRELAIQVADAIQVYARHLPGVRVLPIYGGQAYGEQLRPLKRGVHIVVGTPGRVIDHLTRGTLRLDHISTVVLDEADEMLKMGFLEDVTSILDRTPAERQVALFSATLPEAIQRIAQKHLREPVAVRIKSQTVTVSSVRQRYCVVSARTKPDALLRVIEVEDADAMLIFVRTRSATVEVAERLEAHGFAAAPLNGDMNQQARERTVKRLRDGKINIVVATDIAARGLDVDRISHVVNYDIPHDTEAYIHRIGRTGRAGRVGEALLFIRHRERRMLHAIERATRQQIAAMPIPDAEAITARRVARFKQRIANTIESRDLRFFTQLLQDCEAELRTKPIRIAAAIAYLAQENRPLVPRPGQYDDLNERAKKPRTAARGELSPPRRQSKPSGPRFDDGRVPPETGMVRYRIEVGTKDGVRPKDVADAISGEAELEQRFIGPIQLRERFGFVDLPEGMPKPLFRHLKRVMVRDRALRITRV